MTNSMDPDQTALIGAVCSGSTLFASILNSSVMLGNYLQQMTSADDIFRCTFSWRFKGLIICYWCDWCILGYHLLQFYTIDLFGFWLLTIFSIDYSQTLDNFFFRQPVQYNTINTSTGSYSSSHDSDTTAVLSRYKYYTKLAPHSDSTFVSFYCCASCLAEVQQINGFKLGNFSCFCCHLLTFSKLYLLQKNFPEHYQSVKQFGSRSGFGFILFANIISNDKSCLWQGKFKHWLPPTAVKKSVIHINTGLQLD